MQSWFTVYFLDSGNPCYDQLTPVKTRYPLTSITWPYRELKFRAYRGHVFSVGSRAHVRLTCCKRSRVVRKPVNANPGLIKSLQKCKYFLYTNIFHYFCFVYFEIIQTQNIRPNNIQKTSQ